MQSKSTIEWSWRLSLGTFLIFICAFSGFGCRTFSASPHKPDEVLIADFQKNKEKFDRLLKMAEADKKSMEVRLDGKFPPKDVDAERVEEYKKILREIDVKEMHIITGYSDNRVLIIDLKSSTEHYFSSLLRWDEVAASKGYYLTRFQVENNSVVSIVDNLDKYNYQEGGKIFFRPLEGDWYLRLHLSKIGKNLGKKD